MDTYLLTYRGQIRALLSAGQQAWFVTTHSEQQPTALYRIELEKELPQLWSVALPCGATALARLDTQLWLAGTDGQLYHLPWEGGIPAVLAGLNFGPDPILALAPLAGAALAVLQATQVHLVQRHARVQTLTLPQGATVMASDPSGTWLAVGQQQGVVSVYQWVESELRLSDSRPLHQGAVTALAFQPQELSFYSAGADKKLYLTHAQGQLEPIDKGKASTHDEPIDAIQVGPQRFYTGARDKSLKAWAYSGGQPVTLKQGLPKIAALGHVQHQDRKSLLVAGRDASFSLVSLDAEGKLGEVQVRLEDGYHWAKQLFQRRDAKERETAIELLTGYDDLRAWQLLQQQLGRETDPELRSHCVQAAAKSQHPQSLPLLEAALKDKQAAKIRSLAFQALLTRLGPEALQPYEQALASGFIDLGTLALETLAQRLPERAPQLLVPALKHSQAALRLQALHQLERLGPPQSPQASLQALQGAYADVQRVALIRLLHRKLLTDFAAQRAVFLAQEHDDPSVRRIALLVAILGQPALAAALQQRDADWARQLYELEHFDTLTGTAPKSPLRASVVKPTPLPHDLPTAVLLQALSNRYADVSFQAAYALALLQDAQAFGSLLLLAQESAASIRAGVCRALACLGQIEGTLEALELRLDDEAPEVRDAAFNALLHLQQNPLATATVGLRSQAQDIHARALKLILEQPRLPADVALLQTALDDRFAAIRQETCKACFKRQLGGDLAGTLALLLRSHYEDVHQEVLQEIMAQPSPAPAGVIPVLTQLYADPFASVRLAALDFTLANPKRYAPIQTLAAALTSPFEDIRRRICTYIQQHPESAYQSMLATLATDTDAQVRTEALALLVNGAQVPAVVAALASPFVDIQVQAASALASWGDRRALPILLELLARPEPRTPTERPVWLNLTQRILQALGQLGAPEAFAAICRFISAGEASLVSAAAQALPWVATPQQQAELRQLQQDARPTVRVQASFALALLGENSGLLDDPQLAQHLPLLSQLAARLTLGPVTPVSLQAYLLAPETRTVALYVLAAYELWQHPAHPRRLMGALSVRQAEVQLFSADLLARYGDWAACWAYLQQDLVRDGATSPWTPPLAQIQALTAALIHHDGQQKAQILHGLQLLLGSSNASAWNHHYQRFTQRHPEMLSQPPPTVLASAPDPIQVIQWQQHSLGAYLGLLRQDVPEAQRATVLGLRLKALRGLARLAEQSPSLRPRVCASFSGLLQHAQAEIRQYAWNQLPKLGLNPAQIGQLALTSPHSDIARQGLKLLMAHAPGNTAHNLLEQLMLEGNELLALEAYTLYRDTVGVQPAALLALRAQNLALREQGLQDYLRQHPLAPVPDAAATQGKDAAWWQAQYAAQDRLTVLQTACRNDHFPVALQALTALTQAQHPLALDSLMARWVQTSGVEEQQALLAITAHLSQPAVAQRLLDMLASPSNRLPAAAWYARITPYRNPEIFASLLQRLSRYPDERQAIIVALVAITGADQPLPDPEAYPPPRDQHPRRDELLITLFQTLLRLNLVPEALGLCPALGQAAGTDAALAGAVPILPPTQLAPVVFALGVRLRQRQGDPAVLVPLLSHADRKLAFLAAETLAQAGHAQGFNLLRAAIDYHTDADYRRRAVLALGQTGDTRALDKLLELAQDAAHALYPAALEALGYLASGEQAEVIFRLLKHSLYHESYSQIVPQAALSGLRGCNTLAAWQLLSAYAAEEAHPANNRSHAVTLLRHWDSAASRALLLHLLRTETDFAVVKAAYRSAQTLWDAAPYSAVDLALLQGWHADLDATALPRILTHAPVEVQLELLTARYADGEQRVRVQEPLVQHLNLRPDLPCTALRPLLNHADPTLVTIGAQLYASQAPSAVAAADLEAALQQHYALWQKEIATPMDADTSETALLEQQAVQHLLWARLKHGGLGTVAHTLLQTPGRDHEPLHLTLLTALNAQQIPADPALLDAVTPWLHRDNPRLSALAASWLLPQTPAVSLPWQALLHQPQSLMAPRFTAALLAAAETSEQTQVLPLLIAQQAVAPLATLAQKSTLPEPLRLGAIEALAHIAQPEAQAALQTLRQQATDPDIAKAAYRALRRWQRRHAPVATLGA